VKQYREHKILIAGATGLIGTALSDYFQKQGWKINFLTTSKDKLISTTEMQAFYWNPMLGEIDPVALDGVSVVINLAGASIDQRWNDRAKYAIINSRISSNETLFESLSNTPNQVKHIICASAIGIYPDGGDLFFDESFQTEEPNGFLQSIVAEWEASANIFNSLGVTLSKIRIGLVLSNDGGVLKKLKPLAKWGVLSPMGAGNQWQSWIHIHDLTRVFNFVLDEKLSGVINGVAPNPLSNKLFVEAIARSVHRKIVLPAVPSFVLKTVLGEMSEIVLNGSRVSPKVLLEKDFKFDYLYIDEALSHLAEN